jgi:hypothetical protein
MVLFYFSYLMEDIKEFKDLESTLRNFRYGLGVVPYTCNPSTWTWEVEARRIERLRATRAM